ncbi:Mobile element protein (plasmid) [Candidatus Enterovibrio escicola]|uniref:Mobile element protein n=1 Tax=Candidatus Enterovibrio escicola TaxID=1927127 RepID=A0A2A5T755_9GAMM|nr:Mobile element protein [Candidatus Enterovibrio escacola]
MPRKQPLLTQLEREELKSIPGDESTLIRLTSFTQKEKDLIEDYWDDILRLASSIRQGSVTASLILHKLGSYPRQNGLALALRDFGRLERTLFMLEWIQSPELRRRVQVGLNKGEARNALARTVFFNQLGEIRDRSFEQQRYRASGNCSLEYNLLEKSSRNP